MLNSYIHRLYCYCRMLVLGLVSAGLVQVAYATTVFVGSDNGNIVAYGLSGTAEFLLSTGKPIKGISGDAASSSLFVGFDDGLISIYDVSTRTISGSFNSRVSGVLQSVALTDGGKILLASSDNGTITEFDVLTHNAIKTFQAAGQPVTSLSSAALNLTVFAATDGGEIRAIDFLAGSSTLYSVAASVNSTVLTKNGASLFVGFSDGLVSIYDVSTRTFIGSLSTRVSGSLRSIALAENDSILLAGSDNGSITKFDVATRGAIGTFFTPGQVVTALAVVSAVPEGSVLSQLSIGLLAIVLLVRRQQDVKRSD